MKNQCTYQEEAERWFDGETDVSAAIESHVESCESCKAHIAFLEECREAIAEAGEKPVIGDAQIPVFLEGIAEGINAPRRRFTGIFAMASGLAAALIVAVSAMTMVSSGPDPVGAESGIETVSTDIDGATVEILHDDDTTPMVWLHLPEGGEI